MARERRTIVRWTSSGAMLMGTALAGAGCESSVATAAAERSDSAGVEIVTSPAEDRPLAASFVAEFRLGGRDTDEESFYRVNGSTVGTDELGRIHVLDGSAHRVVVFDAQGRHLWSAGQQGEGPGELGMPAGLVVMPDGESLVMDFSKEGLVGFREGEPGGTRRLPFPFFGGALGAQGEDVLVLQSGSADAVQRLVRVTVAGDTTVVLSRQGAAMKPIELTRGCRIALSGMPPLFDPQIHWTARDSLLAVAPDAAYRIEIHDGQEVVRVIRRELPVRPADRAAAVAEVGEGMRIRTSAGDQLCDADEVVEKRGFLSELPWIEALALAPDGTLWVERFQPGRDDRGPIDRFDATGAYLGTLPAGTPFPLAFLPDGRMLIREVDEATAVERIAVGRLETDGAG